MLIRRAYNDILKWKNSPKKKALFLTGARQVGKSYLVQYLASQEYESFIEVNLLEDERARSLLQGAENTQDLLSRVSMLTNNPLLPGKTLIFFDEIQALPSLFTYAKFLAQDDRFDVAFSGSMLGVIVKGTQSYPVGYVTEIAVHPLDFEEFCWAQGVSENILKSMAQNCLEGRSVEESLHNYLLDLFRKYVVIGGMPEVVQDYVDSHGDMALVRETQLQLVEGYRRDIGKYAGKRALNTAKIFDQLPLELNKESTRFVLSNMKENAKYNQFNNDFDWLTEAGVALKTSLITDPKPPLGSHVSPGYFKLYESDTGMLVARYGEGVARDIYADDAIGNYGGIFENVVAQQLACARKNLYYFSNRKMGEVDFITEDSRGRVIPIEVKSGRSPQLHASLTRLVENKEYRIERGYVISRLNIKKEGKIIYLPWYALACMKNLLE
jgi:hypothetical protein